MLDDSKDESSLFHPQSDDSIIIGDEKSPDIINERQSLNETPSRENSMVKTMQAVNQRHDKAVISINSY